jgi:signal peptidase I
MEPPPGTVNPYVAMASSEGGERRAPRWLAILLSVVTLPVAGTGLFVLGKTRRAWIWVGVSALVAILYGLAPAASARLVIPLVALQAVLWIAGIVVTCLAEPGEFRGWNRTVVVALAIVAGNQVLNRGVKKTAAEGFSIPAGSMAPTLLIGDHVMVAKALVGAPARGDVIVFQYPLGPETLYIKRVIGLPGETVAIVNNQVLIDGKPLAVRPLDDACTSPGGGACRLSEEKAGNHTYRVMHDQDRAPVDFGPRPIPAGHYFVVGDNRDNSNDSRVWGTVGAELIKGRAVTIYLSSGPAGPRWGRFGKTVE